MPNKQETLANLIQTLAKAIELSEDAHNYGPEHLTITLHRDYHAEKAHLRIECDEAAVDFDPDRQCLDSVFGALIIKERSNAM